MILSTETSKDHNKRGVYGMGDGQRSTSLRSRRVPMLSPRHTRLAAISAVLLLFYLYASNHQLPGFSNSHGPIPWPNPSLWGDGVDWTRFAYVQYVTSVAYLCNSVMIFEALHRLGAKPDLLMLYPAEYPLDDASEESRLLWKARDQYGVKLVPINIQRRTGDDVTWAESFTKFLVFNQTQYDRVLSLDSDATVLKLMDELFLLPPSTVALPRAYWLKEFEDPKLTSMIALVQPSTTEFERVVKAMQTVGPREYDMEIFNKLYGDTAQIIPHRRYALLTRAFREDHRIAYLGNDNEAWDPKNVFDEAKYLHFSDWPVPKPWVPDHQKMEELKPKCVANDCTAQDTWVGFYSDFASRRLQICGFSVAGSRRDIEESKGVWY